MKEKKQWQKPALMVLVRRKPEEGVLETCKGLFDGQGGAICSQPLCPSANFSFT